MNRPTDEMLVAYADGALEEPARAQVETYLATDAEAREWVAALRASGALAAEAFDRPLHEAPPKALVDAIETFSRPRPAAAGLWRRPDGTARRLAAPLAAAVALAIVSAVGFFAGRMSADRPATPEIALGVVPAGASLAQLLETYPTGRKLDAVARGDAGRRLMVVATFKDRRGRPCREVEVSHAVADSQPLAVGVACRRPDGRWTMEGAVQLADAPAAAGGQYVPSGTGEKDALDGLLAMLGAQSALSAEEEQALIGQGWR